MFTPKPITRKDIVVGKRYIEVVVCIDGTIFLDKHIFLAKPVRRKYGWWIRVHRKERGRSRSDDRLGNFHHLEDLGIIHDKKDNHHRTFRATRATERFLKKFVQDRGGTRRYAAYLKFLGFENPREAVKQELVRYQNFERLEGEARLSNI